jgi:hypothetical protein
MRNKRNVKTRSFQRSQLHTNSVKKHRSRLITAEFGENLQCSAFPLTIPQRRLRQVGSQPLSEPDQKPGFLIGNVPCAAIG